MRQYLLLLLAIVGLLSPSIGCNQHRYQPADWSARKASFSSLPESSSAVSGRITSGSTLQGRNGSTLPGRRIGSTLPGRFQGSTLPYQGSTLPAAGRFSGSTLPGRGMQGSTLPGGRGYNSDSKPPSRSRFSTLPY